MSGGGVGYGNKGRKSSWSCWESNTKPNAHIHNSKECNVLFKASFMAIRAQQGGLRKFEQPFSFLLLPSLQVLLTEFGCHEWSIDGPAPALAIPQIEGSSQNPAANAPQSAPRNVVPPLTLLPLTLLYSSQTVYLDLDGNAKSPSVPVQRVITSHLMRLLPSHQYVPGNIFLTRSEQTLDLQSSQRFKACPTDPNDILFGLHFPIPAPDSQIQAHPSLKEKAWHLTWMTLDFLASLRS